LADGRSFFVIVERACSCRFLRDTARRSHRSVRNRTIPERRMVLRHLFLLAGDARQGANDAPGPAGFTTFVYGISIVRMPRRICRWRKILLDRGFVVGEKLIPILVAIRVIQPVRPFSMCMCPVAENIITPICRSFLSVRSFYKIRLLLIFKPSFLMYVSIGGYPAQCV